MSLLPIILVSCTSVTLPIQEYALARSAMESAEFNDAERLSPIVFQQAQQIFNQAERLYRDREYEDARLQFIKARKLAEKAEVTARIKKSKTGEVL
jgi:hypothetical protein